LKGESKLKRKGKTKMRKLFTWESSQQAKEEQRNLFVFSLKLQLTKIKRKTDNKQGNIFGFSESFSNTQKESKKMNLTRIIQWKCGNTDNLK
jgi:hypothetical protein